MVHLACETDFVARNDVFRNVAKGIAETAAFLDVPGTEEAPAPAKGSDPVQVFPTDQLLAAPLISLAEGEASKESQSISQLLVASVSQTGENLQLRRAVSFAAPFPVKAGRRFVPGAYTHGGDASTGKIGGIVILDVAATGETPVNLLLGKKPELEEELNALARNLARQVVGFPTKALSPGEGVAEEEALLTQPFMMGGSDKPVAEVIKAWGEERGLEVEIMTLRRWSTSDEL
jgi:elongation factor Ts